MSIRAFFKVYSLPFFVVLVGIAIYGVVVIVMDKENLILSRNDLHYSLDPIPPIDNLKNNVNEKQDVAPREYISPVVVESNSVEIDKISQNNTDTQGDIESPSSNPNSPLLQPSNPSNPINEPQVAQTQEENYFARHRANIRKMPSSESPVIAMAQEGEKLILLESQSGWSKVKNSYGLEGYIATRLISKADSALSQPQTQQVGTPYIVLANSLNVRIEPDKHSMLIGSLVRNQNIIVIETQGEWAKIKLSNGQYGYIALQFIAKDTSN